MSDTHRSDEARIAKAKADGKIYYTGSCDPVSINSPYTMCGKYGSPMVLVHWTEQVQEWRLLCTRHANILRKKGVRVTLNRRCL